MMNIDNALLLNQLKKDKKTLYTIKTQEEIEKMRIAGRLAGQVLTDLGEHIKPGVTTRQLEAITRDLIVNKYKSEVDRTDLEGHSMNDFQCFTYTRNHVFGLCAVDDYPLQKGELFGADVSLKKDGWCGDTSRVWIVGDETSPRVRNLVAVAYEAMWVGIRLVKPGVHLGTIACAVEQYVKSHGFSVIKIPGQTAHSIGRVHCEGMLIPFYGAQPNTGIALEKGMTITIEPGVATGDGWGDRLDNREKTMIMRDNQYCCFWEHVLAVTDTGYDILDWRDGESEYPSKNMYGYVPTL